MDETQSMAQAMAAAQNGDKLAYGRVLGYSRTWCLKYFRSRVADGQIEDLVQEVLLAVHAKRHTFDANQPYAPWLAAIARYKWIDYLRGLYRRAEVDLPQTLAADDEEEPLLAHLSLAQLLKLLKPAQSQVIKLVKLEGRTVEEAARLTGQSQALVRVNIHRGLKNILMVLEQ
jgi:RNA polymerase sigma factor (sigma-70 family)